MTHWENVDPEDIYYPDYIKSIEWLIKSKVFIGRRGYKCERCGVTDKPLFSHHLHYKTLGREKDEDVQVLCFGCHQIADEERIEKQQAEWDHKREYGPYNSGLQSWACNKYGENWERRSDAAHIRKQFDNWIGFRRDKY